MVEADTTKGEDNEVRIKRELKNLSFGTRKYIETKVEKKETIMVTVLLIWNIFLSICLLLIIAYFIVAKPYANAVINTENVIIQNSKIMNIEGNKHG